jgi:hypothetical protein
MGDLKRQSSRRRIGGWSLSVIVKVLVWKKKECCKSQLLTHDGQRAHRRSAFLILHDARLYSASNMCNSAKPRRHKFFFNGRKRVKTVGFSLADEIYSSPLETIKGPNLLLKSLPLFISRSNDEKNDQLKTWREPNDNYRYNLMMPLFK